MPWRRWLAVTVLVAAACGGNDSPSEGGDTCTVGEADCACTAGGGCDPGLSCVEDVCVPDGGTSDGTGGADGGTSSDETGDQTTTDGSSSDATTSDVGTTTATSGSGSGSTSANTTGTLTTGATSSTTTATPANFVFVSSTQHVAGDLGGLAGADAICNQRASAAGLPGTYVAWMSDAANDAVDRLGNARGWVRTDGELFAIDIPDLLAHRVYYPIIYDENGDVSGLGHLVLTSTQSNGTKADSDGLYCGNWTQTNDMMTRFPVGRVGGGNRYWTEYESAGCGDMGHLWCFGTDLQVDLTFTPQTGRLAFTSRGALPADAGRDAADAQCQQVAQLAGHTGTFLAAMAMPGEAIQDRFDLNGDPWVRVDGLPLFPLWDPMGPVMFAPMLYDADGSFVPYSLVWSGAQNPQMIATSQNTCNGWTETMGDAKMGTSWDMLWHDWSVAATEECTVDVGVFCFEE